MTNICPGGQCLQSLVRTLKFDVVHLFIFGYLRAARPPKHIGKVSRCTGVSKILIRPALNINTIVYQCNPLRMDVNGGPDVVEREHRVIDIYRSAIGRPEERVSDAVFVARRQKVNGSGRDEADDLIGC